MPNDERLEATWKEKESSLICSLIKYAYGHIGHKEVPAWVSNAAGDYYGCPERLKEARRMLLECLRGLMGSEVEALVYNAHSRQSRRLADWWEKYQKEEGRKCADKKDEQMGSLLREQALKKLTVAEIESLSIK